MATLWALLLFSVSMFSAVIEQGTKIVDVFHLIILETDIGFTLRFDALSSLIFLMVIILGLVIGHFSKRYLDGEKRQDYFYKHMLGIILSVSGLVLSNNLLMFFVLWSLSGFHLHKLLLFYPERPKAVLATRKKKFIGRIGDVSILGATLLLLATYGTSDLSEILSSSRTFSSHFITEIFGILLVFGAVAKSAQFPFHFWLPDTMESPTPVSAIMHAGVINAGGFLIIRFSPLLEQAYIAHGMLIIIGAFTATYAALVMTTQNNIKRKLAFSTISQMGIMLFACGLGAYPLALVHIVAHSFYKAHAFMHTGSLVEESKKLSLKLIPLPSPIFFTLVVAGLAIIYTGYNMWDGLFLHICSYAAIMFFSIAQNWFKRPATHISVRVPMVRILGLLLLGFTGYLFIEVEITRFLLEIIPSSQTTAAMTRANLAPILIAYILFTTGFFMSGRMSTLKTPFYKRLYMHFWNGGYLGPKTDFILSKYWSGPPKKEKA